MYTTLLPLLLLASPLVSASDHHKRAAASGPVFDGYYAGYNQFVTPPSAVNYKDYTHLSFFVGESTNGYGINLNTTLNADAVIKDTIKRAKAAKVKSVLVIGGWSGSRYFSNLFATASRRTNYAKSLQKLIQQYSFDGIEIDWEWPGSAGIGNNQNTPADSANFLLFLNQLRATLGAAPLITISVAASGLKDANGATITDYSTWLKAVDYFKLMDYDMNGPWVYACDCLRIRLPHPPLHWYNAIPKQAKVPGSKIILIVPGYGVSYSTKYSTLKKVKTTTGRDSQAFQPLFNQNPQVGNVTWSGLIGQGLLNRDGTAILPYKRYWDACTSTPFLWNSKLTSFVTYDDPASISAKAAFAKAQGLAGISLFEISQDLNGDLIKAAKAAFNSGKAKRDLGESEKIEL